MKRIEKEYKDIEIIGNEIMVDVVREGKKGIVMPKGVFDGSHPSKVIKVGPNVKKVDVGDFVILRGHYNEARKAMMINSETILFKGVEYEMLHEADIRYKVKY